MNLTGAANICYCAAQQMIKQKSGRIVNISSRGAFRGDAQVATFLYCVCYNKGVDALKKDKPSLSIDHLAWKQWMDESENVVQKMIKADQVNELHQKMKQLGKRCQLIIRMKWFWKYSMSEIAESMDFPTEDAARMKSFRCLKSLKKLFMEGGQA